MAALRTGLRMLLPLRPAMVLRSLPLLLPSFCSAPRPLPHVAPVFFPPPLLQVRCMNGSLKTKGKPRGPLWRQRKGVSKEALQVVFELKRCKGEKLKERAVLRTSAARLLKMDLLMVLIELRRQDECSLAKQKHCYANKLSPWAVGFWWMLH